MGPSSPVRLRRPCRGQIAVTQYLMGNLAIKCENQWQSRKVFVNCTGGPLDVRIMRTDGMEDEEFPRAVVAAEVMYRFPEYVVIRCSSVMNTKLGKRGQLRVLQPHDVLIPGDVYFLFPIPLEVATNNDWRRGRRFRRMQQAKNRLSLLWKRSETGFNESPLDFGTSTEASRLDEKEISKSSLNSGRWNPGMLTPLRDAALAKLKENHEIEMEGVDVEADSEVRSYHAGITSTTWRPALVSIPESPVGFHSRSESPLSPIAFRLVSFREGESFFIESNEPPVML